MSSVEPAAPVLRGTIVGSIVIFWSFYFVIATARAMIDGQSGQLLRCAPRLLTSVAGGLATMAVYLVLRRVATKRSLLQTMTIAMFLSVPAALAYGVTNWCLFDLALPVLSRSVTAAGDAASANSVNVGAPMQYDEMNSPLAEIAETALNGYFFFVAWCALYAALRYSAQLSASEQRSERLRTMAQAAELRALRYQINPHFLFNTMNSLSSLVMAGRAGEAEQMIAGLSTFFRASLTSDATQDVPLFEEIALQRLYLDIERVRFGDRLRVVTTIPPELEQACVPGLILQPLVENVIKHAVSKTRHPVTLHVTASRHARTLCLEVRDDGTVAPQVVAEGSPGVGLTNVRERLATRFGDDGAISWQRQAGEFVVILNMPLTFDDR